METIIAMPTATVLTAEAIERLPQRPLGRVEGVTHRVLWTGATSMAGVMTVAAGHRLGAHTHRTHHHHVWVLDGHAELLGETVGPGSYAHVPAGVEHDLDATRTEGCTFFYLYLKPGD
jgi:quercetin dioxygenase-like cupin family protein